jgi:hypothetical protein
MFARAGPAQGRRRKADKLDFVDLLLVSPGLALLIYGLAESDSAGGFGATKVWGTMLAGACC